MIKKLVLFVACVVFLISNDALAQSYRIFGKVVDDSTKSPIPFASVAIAGLNLGTSTNIEGEFQIRVDSLPVGLIFSHVSYDKKEIIVQSPDYITISMTPRKVILEELVINERDRGDFPYWLLLQAYRHAVNQSRDWKYGLAYYRQTSQNAEDFSELYEIFYDTRYSSQGIVDWDIQEGRYAMKSDKSVSEYVFNKNFTLLSRLVTMYQPETDKFIMPVNERVRDLYDLYISELIAVEDRKVAIVNFAPKEEIPVPAMSGRIFIDIDNFDIFKIEGQIRHDNLDIIALTNPRGSWKDYVLNLDIAYRLNGEELLLDYISMTQRFDYFLDGQPLRSVETNSLLTYYEYYTPEKFKRLGGRLMRLRKSDRELLDRVGYNRRFWEENPIVKRTPVEDEIISSFEAVNAFGSIYLNDREQIQLEKDELSNDPFVQQLTIDLRKAKIANFGEKVYFHLDKPFYASGETIWFSAYLVNIGTLIRTDRSKVLYVDLISPEGNILSHKRFFIDNGLCEGHIDLGKGLPSGNYRIRAYTNWMKNYSNTLFYNKTLGVYNMDEDLYTVYTDASEDPDFDVQFFPEGGQLIHNITSQVAFKAIDHSGKGIDVEGKVIDAEGNLVANFDSRHDGMGSFFINPQLNLNYKALVKFGREEREFEFLSVQAEGYTLTVNNLRDRNIQVMLKNSPMLNDTELYVILQSRGMIFHREKANLKRGMAIINIPKAKIPDGVAQITLFNTDHVPISERLVFIDHGQNISPAIETENQVIGPRDKISMKLTVKDQYGKALRNTSFSVAVTDTEHIQKDQFIENITSHLLMTSELRGHIEDPGYYFQEDNRDTRIDIDLLMLTHGWRRFTWEAIADGSLVEVSHLHENGINISGIALSKSNKSVPNTFLKFIPFDNEFFSLWEAVTGQNGKFEIKGLIIPDSIQVIAKSVNERGNSEDAILDLDPYDKDIPEILVDPQIHDLDINDQILQYVEFDNERQRVYAMNNVQDRVLLKEVVVRDTRPEPDRMYGEPDNVLILDETMWNFDNIFQVIQGRIPGVQVSGSGMNTKVRIRGSNTITGSNEPLFLVDGVIMNSVNSNFGGDSTAMDDSDSFINASILSILPRDVERIEVLKNAGATMFGVRGANGVIAIYTRRGPRDPDPNNEGITGDIVYLPGFHLVKEFYAPKYDAVGDDEPKADKRTTLYWNPSIKTNNLGTAEIEFFNSDEATRLQVDLQGITDYGDPVNMTMYIGEEVIK